MYASRTLEQAAVRVGHSGVEAVLRTRSGLVQRGEEPVEIVGARSARIGDQAVDELGETMAGDLGEILGEEAPDGLEQEVAENVVVGRETVLQLLVEIDDVHDGLARERGLPAGEDRLGPGEEEECSYWSGRSIRSSTSRGSFGKAPGSQISSRRKEQSTTQRGEGTFVAGSAAFRQ